MVDTFDGNGLLVTGAYDRLGQLTNFARGELNGAKDTISSLTGPGARSQTWTLDAQGNWPTLVTTTSSGTSTQNRTHNQQNQTSITGLTNQLTYDNNGNLTKDETGRGLKYDAWNRLVEVNDGATPIPGIYEPSSNLYRGAIQSGLEGRSGNIGAMSSSML